MTTGIVPERARQATRRVLEETAPPDLCRLAMCRLTMCRPTM